MAYRVFISHKSEDKLVAQAVREHLGDFSGEFEFFISGDDIPAGSDWEAVLREKLRSSDMLLLLFTEPTLDWDWCLYEVGLFTSLDDDNVRNPIICIHSAGSVPPGPLHSTQVVSATETEVEHFVDSLIRKVDITGLPQPLNRNASDQRIKDAAKAISTAVGGKVEPRYTCYRLYLELPEAPVGCEAIPDNAVVNGSEGTMRVFGRAPGRVTWGTLVGERRAAQELWLNEVDRVFRTSCQGGLAAPTTHTFRAYDGARIFRPELYRLDTRDGRPVAAVIVLTEEVAPAKVGGPLFSRLRIAERYQTEVFDRLGDDGETLGDDLVAELLEAFCLIREEAKAHDVFDEDSLKVNFSDSTLGALGQIADAWDIGYRVLKTAKDAGDNARVTAAFRQLAELNDDYRAIVAQRYAELLAADSS